MRFTWIDHIGIAVEDFDAAVACYAKLHGVAPAKIVDVAAEQVRVAMFPVGPTKIELLGATSPESPIATFIAKKGPGLHHLCYGVQDLTAAVRELTAEGFTTIGAAQPAGADGHPFVFFHPQSTGGVLIELVEQD